MKHPLFTFAEALLRRVATLVVALALVAIAPAAVAADDESDPAFQRAFQTAVRTNNRTWLADNTSYPLEVVVDGKWIKVKNRAQFLTYYEAIMTPFVRNAVLTTKLPQAPIGWRGVMFGNGQVWISGTKPAVAPPGAPFKTKIIGINNVPKPPPHPDVVPGENLGSGGGSISAGKPAGAAKPWWRVTDAVGRSWTSLATDCSGQPSDVDEHLAERGDLSTDSGFFCASFHDLDKDGVEELLAGSRCNAQGRACTQFWWFRWINDAWTPIHTINSSYPLVGEGPPGGWPSLAGLTIANRQGSIVAPAAWAGVRYAATGAATVAVTQLQELHGKRPQATPPASLPPTPPADLPVTELRGRYLYLIEDKRECAPEYMLTKRRCYAHVIAYMQSRNLKEMQVVLLDDPLPLGARVYSHVGFDFTFGKVKRRDDGSYSADAHRWYDPGINYPRGQICQSLNGRDEHSGVVIVNGPGGKMAQAYNMAVCRTLQ